MVFYMGWCYVDYGFQLGEVTKRSDLNSPDAFTGQAIAGEHLES